MPFRNQKQKRFFAACKSGRASKACPPRDIVAEFFAADRMDRMSAKGREAKRGRPRRT